MRVRVRFYLPDENGESRRDRAERFGREDDGPQLDIPADFFHIWGWYWTISSRLRRVREGVTEPIPASEFLAWCTASDTIVNSIEYAMLCAMDDAFCEEMNVEMKDYRIRQEEEQKQKQEQNRNSMPWRKR